MTRAPWIIACAVAGAAMVATAAAAQPGPQRGSREVPPGALIIVQIGRAHV